MSRAVVDKNLGGPEKIAMSVSMEEGEHNGDHLDRVEEVRCLYQRLHVDIADGVFPESWHQRKIRSYPSLKKALHSKWRSDEIMTSGGCRSRICMAGVRKHSPDGVLRDI